MTGARPTRWPVVTRDQMRRLDELMVAEARIDLVRMMENAGRGLAAHVLAAHRPRRVLIAAGRGGNGGGALVCARHLANRGLAVEVVLAADPADLTPVTGDQLAALTATGARVLTVDGADVANRAPDLVVDGLVGYSLRGAPRGRVAELVAAIVGTGAPVVSLDVPTGVDVDTGAEPGLCIDATDTVTLALPKAGLFGSPRVGRLLCADIGVPPALWRRVGVEVPVDLFGDRWVVPVTGP
ncbi:MAG: NAD(P)H-hydrate epimerase [Actinomyces sp.]|nr:MAG: NAD(P)H-hydrate epimerase [Actinomyces sp.]